MIWLFIYLFGFVVFQFLAAHNDLDWFDGLFFPLVWPIILIFVIISLPYLAWRYVNK